MGHDAKSFLIILWHTALNSRASHFCVAKQESKQSATDKELEEKSKIYAGTKKPLTKYQQAVNKAALELSKQDYSLLLNRGKLFEESRVKVMEDGYEFVKGKSRVKGCEQPVKRVKTTKDDRDENIKLLNQDILAKEEQIRFKEQRVAMAKNSKNWELCDKLTGEICKLRKETFELKQEVKLIKRKEAQSLWYEKSKQKKVEGKKSNEVIHIDESDEVISTDARDSSTSSCSTIPSLFNRLSKEQSTLVTKSVPDQSNTEEAVTNSTDENATNSPVSESRPAEITNAELTENVQQTKCEQNEDTNFHFL